MDKKIIELARDLKARDPQGLASVPDQVLVSAVAAVYQHINASLVGVEDGEVNIGGLGQFRVRQVVHEKDGEKIKRRHITFRGAMARPGGDSVKGAHSRAADAGRRRPRTEPAEKGSEPRTSYQRAQQLYKDGRLKEAVELYRGLYQRRMDPKTARHIVRLHQQLKDEAAAASALTGCLKDFPDDFMLNHLLARDSHSLGDFQTYHRAVLKMRGAAAGGAVDTRNPIFWPFLPAAGGYKGKYLFVSGAPRSGTSALGRLLNLSPEILLFIERYPVLYGYAKGMFTKDRLSRLEGHPHKERNKALLDRYEQTRFLGDKRPNFALSLRATMENFSAHEVRVVHIVRDPREVGLSFEARAASELDTWSRDRGFGAAIEEVNWNNREILHALANPDWARSIRVVGYGKFWGAVESAHDLFRWLGASFPPEAEPILKAMYAEAKSIAAKERPISAEQERMLDERFDKAAYQRVLEQSPSR